MSRKYADQIKSILSSMTREEIKNFVREGEEIVLEIDSESIVLSRREEIISARALSASDRGFQYRLPKE
ncbi:MAG: hypothetical protein BAJATHORv1_10059 [Candidatus Thorarchaeota archaeon]|nr:MAG: hypothetical protein BAJATHORv1_10059 [Candidatus Thorarchaeota archaeon]